MPRVIIMEIINCNKKEKTQRRKEPVSMRRQDLKGDPGRLNSFLKYYDTSAPTHLAPETNCVCRITITFACMCAQTITLKLSFCAEELSNPLFGRYRILQRGDACANSSWGILCVCKFATWQKAWHAARGVTASGAVALGMCMQRYRHSPLFCKLTYSHADFHPAPRRKGGELPPTCKRDRG